MERNYAANVPVIKNYRVQELCWVIFGLIANPVVPGAMGINTYYILITAENMDVGYV